MCTDQCYVSVGGIILPFKLLRFPKRTANMEPHPDSQGCVLEGSTLKDVLRPRISLVQFITLQLKLTYLHDSGSCAIRLFCFVAYFLRSSSLKECRWCAEHILVHHGFRTEGSYNCHCQFCISWTIDHYISTAMLCKDNA